MREGISYRFTHAVVRKPPDSIAKGLRAFDRGAPNPALFRAQHEAYVNTLESLGLEVTVLPALEDYPDSVFIEDTALCLPEGAVILRPGAVTRLGEARESAEALAGIGFSLVEVGSGGTVDGGDILVTGTAVLVGLSSRTNREGFDSLRDLLRNWGYDARAVQTPAGVLHFKSDCNALDDDTLLCTSRLSSDPQLEEYRVLTVPKGEEAAANSIRINDKVLVPEGFPGTAEMLTRSGFDVELLPVSQAALLDGGLSCMSLRFSPDV